MGPGARHTDPPVSTVHPPIRPPVRPGTHGTTAPRPPSVPGRPSATGAAGPVPARYFAARPPAGARPGALVPGAPAPVRPPPRPGAAQVAVRRRRGLGARAARPPRPAANLGRAVDPGGRPANFPVRRTHGRPPRLCAPHAPGARRAGRRPTGGGGRGRGRGSGRGDEYRLVYLGPGWEGTTRRKDGPSSRPSVCSDGRPTRCLPLGPILRRHFSPSTRAARGLGLSFPKVGEGTP